MKDFKLSINDGEFLIRYARKAVREYIFNGRRIDTPEDMPKKLKEKRGAFVALEKIVISEDNIRKRVFRGRMGIPYPNYPLIDVVIDSAIQVALKDPRFSPLSIGELSRVVFEVTILSTPKLIEIKDPRDYPKKIKVGLHGVIVEVGEYRGIILPQVAVEFNWNEEKILEQACIRAGLAPDFWLTSKINVYKFTTQIFYELKPNGKVIERMTYFGI